MKFIGKDGFPAPCIKNAELSEDKLRTCYIQCIKIMRKMFQECKLVHADLSEYNILYHKGKIWIIDVSQAIEFDHPKALDFLKRDCISITNFFQKYGIDNCMSVKELFDFITDSNIEDINSYLNSIEKKIQERLKQGTMLTNEEIVEQKVFEKIFIPRTLQEIEEKEMFKNEDLFQNIPVLNISHNVS